MIRKANESDLEACAEISSIPEFSFLNNASKKESIEYLKKYLDLMLVAEDTNQIIGYICGEFITPTFVFIDALTVKEEHRNEGIGTKLFDEFINIIKEKGVTRIKLVADKNFPKSLKFYDDRGMKRTKEYIEFEELI